MKIYLYRASNLKSSLSFMVEVSFWRPLKNIASCDLFVIVKTRANIQAKAFLLFYFYIPIP